MKAGRELDARVAVDVLKREINEEYSSDPTDDNLCHSEFYFLNPDGKTWAFANRVPGYSADRAAAAQIVAHLRAQGGKVWDRFKVQFIQFHEGPVYESVKIFDFEQELERASPEKICLAALEAVRSPA